MTIFVVRYTCTCKSLMDQTQIKTTCIYYAMQRSLKGVCGRWPVLYSGIHMCMCMCTFTCTGTVTCSIIMAPPPLHSLSRGEVFERGLIHAVESVVVEWSHQIRDVLQRSSAQPLLKGKNPGPLVELNFWKDRRADLESVMDQVGHLLVHTHCRQVWHVVPFSTLPPLSRIPPYLLSFPCPFCSSPSPPPPPPNHSPLL